MCRLILTQSSTNSSHTLFGMLTIEFFRGRLFYQGIEGRFNSQSYQEFLLEVLAQTSEHLFVIQDGARYHTSQAMREFFEQHQEHLTVFQLPSYSPDYNPIEYLWRNTKKEATHNKYFAQFAQLTTSVEQTLAAFARQPQTVLNLLGRYCRQMGLAAPQIQLAA